MTKKGCPLCDEAKETLDHARSRVEFDLDVRSLEEDEALRAAHALEVPVIFVDGKKKMFGKVSSTLLLRELRAAARGA